jgi:endonuclease-3
MGRARFREVIAALERMYGRPAPPDVIDPFEMILKENVAYLVSDERRDGAFHLLKQRVGTKPGEILGASKAVLLEITGLGGMHPVERVDRLRDIARIAISEFGGDLVPSLDEPPAKARQLLRRFPAVGGPLAERILLFNRRHAVLALDSNGLRVLLRLGFGEASKSYAAAYQSAQAAVEADDPRAGFDLLTRAHLILRAHGKRTCKAASPRCEDCPLSKGCAYYGKGRLRPAGGL